MPNSQETHYTRVLEAMEQITPEHIAVCQIPPRIRDEVMTNIEGWEVAIEMFQNLTAGDASARYFHLGNMAYTFRHSSVYPAVHPNEDAVEIFVEEVVILLASKKQNDLIESFLAALLGRGTTSQLSLLPPSAQHPSPLSPPPPPSQQPPGVPAIGSITDAGAEKRFYCHSCGNKFRFRGDMKRHFKKHFSGAEADALMDS